jgi:hypothetical protein
VDPRDGSPISTLVNGVFGFWTNIQKLKYTFLFCNEDIAWERLQDHIQKCFIGVFGMKNPNLSFQGQLETYFLHKMGSGHLSYYMKKHRNLYKFSQQGW